MSETKRRLEPRTFKVVIRGPLDQEYVEWQETDKLSHFIRINQSHTRGLILRLLEEAGYKEAEHTPKDSES